MLLWLPVQVCLRRILTGTGAAGLKEQDNGTFEEACRKKCPYYFDLFDIMAERSSIRPIMTSDDMDDDVEEEEQEEEEGDELVELRTGKVDDTTGMHPTADNGPATALLESDDDDEENNLQSDKRASTGTNNNNNKKIIISKIKAVSTVGPFKKKRKTATEDAPNMGRGGYFAQLEERKFAVLAETKRHNCEMESLKRDEMKFAIQSQDLDFKMIQVETYCKLKKDYADELTADEVRMQFPGLAALIKDKDFKQ